MVQFCACRIGRSLFGFEFGSVRVHILQVCVCVSMCARDLLRRTSFPPHTNPLSISNTKKKIAIAMQDKHITFAPSAQRGAM
jgi:hypothetical protein